MLLATLPLIAHAAHHHGTASPSSAVTFTNFFVGAYQQHANAEHYGGAPMIDVGSAAPTLRWAFACGGNSASCAQDAYQVQLMDVSDDANVTTVHDSGLVHGSGGAPAHAIPAGVLAPATHYAWRVRVVVATGSPPSAWSSPQRFFASMGPTWRPTPIWAAPLPKGNSNGGGDKPPPSPPGTPRYAFLRASLPLGVASAPVSSAVLFISATSVPRIEHGTDGAVLAAYKLWVGGELVGVGPGRPRCGERGACNWGRREQMYDGFDVTAAAKAAAVANGGSGSLKLFVAGFGQGLANSSVPGGVFGAPKVVAELRVRLRGGALLTLRTGDAGRWIALDAGPVYNPGNNSGCAWYVYPQENFNASAPQTTGTPLAPTASLRTADAAALWAPAQAQSPFALPMTPKPTAPIALLVPGAARTPGDLVNAIVRQVSPGHFTFDLGRELQGGVVLTVTLPAALAALGADPTARRVRVRLGEEMSNNGTAADSGTLLFPPRTTVHPEVNWTLTPTTESQTVTHHEYIEFRFGELLFGNAPLPPPTAAAACVDHAAEGTTASFSCGSKGLVIAGFAFASFGMPAGSCANGTGTLAANASCDASVALAVLDAACVGKASCEVPVPSCSGGTCKAPWDTPDPCHGEHKWLSAATSCKPGPTPPPAPTPPTPAVVSLADIDVSAWVVRLPSSSASAAASAALSAPTSPLLEQVWELCRYTVVGSPLDLWSDSNARQRSIDCAADDVTAMRGQYATSTEMALQRFHSEQLLSSGPSDRVDWSVLPIMAVHDWTMHTGDLSLANATFDRLLAAHARLAYIDAAPGGTGLFNTTDKSIQPLVDWPAGMQDQHVMSDWATIGSTFALYGARELAKLARLLGGAARAAQATSLDATADALRVAMRAQQWNGSAFCDGICAATPHTAFHSTVYALALGAVDDDTQGAAWEYVRSRIDPPFNATTNTMSSKSSAATAGKWPPPEPYSGVGLPCGTYVAQFALTALYANAADRGLSALRVLTSGALNSWVAMLRQGATMTMEMWNSDEKPNLTWSHPWASSPAFVIAWHLFGIRPQTAGFGVVAVRPQPGDLEHGAFRLPTVRGPVDVSFRQTALGATFALNVTLPATMKGAVGVPLPAAAAGLDAMCLTVDGASAPAKIFGHFANVNLGPGGAHQLVLQPCAVVAAA